MKKIKKIIIAILFVMIGTINIFAQQILIVTKTTDPDPFLYFANPNDTTIEGTLQWAIRKANELSVPCKIVFNISGGGQQVFHLNYELPFVTTQLEIDGTTQSGYQFNQPTIIIDGQNIISTALQISNQINCKIKGLYIRNFTYHAIVLFQSSNSEITDNTLNQIHTTETNSTVGIRLMFSNNISIKGNIIGTDNSLSQGIGIGSYGIYNEYNSSNNTIGGTGLKESNTIAYNGARGIWIASGNDNKISGNKIFNNPIGILIQQGANNDKQTPVISSYNESGIVSGTSEPNDIIELFGSTGDENANEYLTSTTADANGNWTATIINNTWDYLLATATNVNENTSKLSNVISSEIDFCLVNPINVSYETENISCYDGNDGSISLNISGGYSPYNIIWETEPIQTLNSITNLKAGIYRFEITDSHDCIKHDSITLTEPYKQTQIYEDLILNYSSSSSLSDVSNAVDKFDNLYVAGTTVDDVLGNKITLIKYNNSGIEQWVRNFNVTSELKKIIIDKQNNIIVIGIKFENNVKSIIATEYNQNGTILWSNLFNFPNNNDEIKDATVDNDNNIIIASNIDSYSKILIVKFDYSGNLLWATNYNDYPSKVNSIVADGNNIYLTGSCLNNFNSDFLTICYSNYGVFQWSKLYNNADDDDEAVSIDIDNTSVYVTGKSFDFSNNYDIVTIKYSKNGNEQWVSKYNGVSNNIDIPSKIAVNNNIYITAKSNNEFNNSDFLTLCYDVNGQLVWGQFYNGASNDNDLPIDLKVTNTNIVVTGLSSDLCTDSDYLTINYKTSGELEWVQRYSSEGYNSDFSNTIALDNNLNVFVSGLSTNKFGNYDITTVKYKNIETQCLSFPNKLKNKDDIQTENLSRNIFMLVNSFMYVAQSKELLNTVYKEAKKSEDFEVRYNTLIQKNPQFKSLIEKQLKNCFYADKPDITEPFKDIESKLIYDNDLYVPNIYIPNINIADLNKLPIIAIGTSEVNDNDEIVGYALSKNGKVKETLISEEFANSSDIPIIIFNNAVKENYYKKETTQKIIDSTLYYKNSLNTFKPYIINYAIAYRYDCSNFSEYSYKLKYVYQNYIQEGGYRKLITKIHKNNLNVYHANPYEIWQIQHINQVDLKGFSFITFEYDWYASKKLVTLTENAAAVGLNGAIECRMSNNGDWYQAIYFPLSYSTYTSNSKGGVTIKNP